MEQKQTGVLANVPESHETTFEGRPFTLPTLIDREGLVTCHTNTVSLLVASCDRFDHRAPTIHASIREEREREP